MSTLDMGIYWLSPRQWTGLPSLTPLTPSLPLVQATERHFFSHRCQASSDREIHPSSSSPQILSHLSPSYQTLTGHEALLVIAFLGFDIWRRQSNSLKPPDINELFINPQPENNMQVKFFKKLPNTFIHELTVAELIFRSSFGSENTSQLTSYFGQPSVGIETKF